MHAKKYLIEFANKANTKDWLRLLIEQVILANGEIPELKLKEVYMAVIDDTMNTFPNLQPYSLNSHSNDILLKKLIHHSGVCALRKEQTIDFSQDITLLWGLNGSGKSSYFKILNEIVGGNIKKEIKNNIYCESAYPISVEISFNTNSNSHTISWDNTNRAISPLNVIRVFDSSYLKGLLNKRTTDETVINPYGLNLFTVITHYIDIIKQKIQDEISQISIPNIEKGKLSANILSIIEKENFSSQDKKSIVYFYDCPQSVLNTIESKKRDITNITSTDFKQKIETLKHNISILERLSIRVNNAIKNYSQEIQLVKELIYNFHILSIESINVKSSLGILSSIGNINSPIWKQFIEAGYKFTNEEHIDGICPYCHQPLNKDSKDLIQAYSLFLNDESEKKLSLVEKAVLDETFKLKHAQFNIYEEKTNLNLSSDDKYLDDFFAQIKNLDDFFHSQYSVLSNCLNKRVIDIDLFDEFYNITLLINNIIGTYKFQIDKLQSMWDEKESELKKITEELLPLEQNKYISENKELFEEWFCTIDKRKKYRQLEKSISTRIITDLSNKAFNELITDKLVNEFNNTLKSIGLNRLSVELMMAGKSKGAVSMILKLNGNDINEILSEGELKGVGLALFIAEAKLQPSKNPIIFDDPVNSLDHHIAANLANMLINIDNQIIVFTHNTLFTDAFECSKEAHICKNNKGGCSNNKGKHIYLYQIQSEGKNDKGVIIQKTLDSAKSYLDRANSYICQSPFTESEKTASHIRKAIERIIDEKILNHQIPTKYSNKNSRINWDGLKGLINDTQTIDKLKELHSRMSGGELHNGTESRENSIEKDEFHNILNYLNELV